MKIYYLDSIFSFGIYEGKTLEEVCMLNPEYINWCLINLNHFYIPDHVIYYLNLVLDFSMSVEAFQARKNKYEKWTEQEKENSNCKEDYNEYRASYDQYDGYNGWDDETIDDAFEGYPENTWNIE